MCITCIHHDCNNCISLNIILESFSFVFWDLALIFEVIVWDLNMNWLKWQTKLKKKTYMGWEGITLGGSLNGIWTQSNITLVAKIRHFGEAATPKGSVARASTLCIIPAHWPYNCGKKHGKNLGQGSAIG